MLPPGDGSMPEKRLQKRVDGGVNIISDNKAGYETLSVLLQRELESLEHHRQVVWLGHDFLTINICFCDSCSSAVIYSPQLINR